MIVPLQHLLAAQDVTQGGSHPSSLVDYEHSAHATDLSIEIQYSDIETNSDTHCKNTNKCKFCPDLVLFDAQSHDLASPVAHIESLWLYQSTQYFPELRPPRNT